MIGFRLSGPARRDMTRILAYSLKRFGPETAEAYEALLLKTLSGIRTDPGAKTVRRVHGYNGLWRLHLRFTPQAGPKAIARPRHVVIFRLDRQSVTIMRILHEKMDAKRHLG